MSDSDEEGRLGLDDSDSELESDLDYSQTDEQLHEAVLDFDDSGSPSDEPFIDAVIDVADDPVEAAQQDPTPPPGLTVSQIERYYKGELHCLHVRAVDLSVEQDDLMTLMQRAMASDPSCLRRLLGDESYMRRLNAQFESTRRMPCNCYATCLAVCPRFFNTTHGQIGPMRKRGKANNTAQNDILETVLFDVFGNSLFHLKCAAAIFKVDRGRLMRRGEVVRERYKSQNTEVLFKHAIPPRRLGDVIVPENVRPLAWWGTLRPTDPVRLRFRSSHGLSNRPSNNAYDATAKEAFLGWCEINSMPTGRITRYHPTRYFSSVFIRIGRYKQSELREPEMARYSVVMAYRACLAEQHAPRIPCEATLCKWLHESPTERYAIQPHQSDYCDTCARFRVELQQMAGRRWAMDKVSADTTENERLLLAAQKESLQREWNAHRARGKAEHDAYALSLARAAEEWAAEDGRDKHAVICVDYMQERTLPYFGSSAQPSETYYKQKLTVHLCGLVQHHGGRSVVYLSDERASGAKVADHLCSYLRDYVRSLPPNVTTLTIWGDNAGTIKSQYLVGWAADCVEEGVLTEINLRFMLPGHTKFSPDALFASISATYRRSDVFNMAQLAGVVDRHACPKVFDHDALLLFRRYLETRYVGLRGIRNMRWIRVRADATSGVTIASSDTNTSEPTRLHRMLRLDAPPLSVPPARQEPTMLDPRKLKDLLHVYQRYAPAAMPDWLAIQGGNELEH